jgi:hypothetical protein
VIAGLCVREVVCAAKRVGAPIWLFLTSGIEPRYNQRTKVKRPGRGFLSRGMHYENNF